MTMGIVATLYIAIQAKRSGQLGRNPATSSPVPELAAVIGIYWLVPDQKLIRLVRLLAAIGVITSLLALSLV